MLFEDLVLRANFRLELRERGKLVRAVEQHNILVDLGRNWLMTAIGESDYATHPQYHQILFLKYLSFGIGGNKQQVDVDSVYPTVGSAYPGTNVQDDTDSTIESLERPVAIRDDGSGNAEWLQEVAYSPGPSSPYTYADFAAHFSETDINVVPGHAFAAVPLAEAALFLSDQVVLQDPYSSSKQVCAFYIGFDTVTKTNQMTMDINWRIRS